MKSIEIDLTFRRSDFEELYFRNGNEKLFFSPTAKKKTFLFILAGLFFLISIMNLIITQSSQELVLFSFVIWSTTIVLLGERIYTILKWRKSIKIYLDKTSKFKVSKVVLTENAFSIIQDDEEIIERWSDFKKVEINSERIQMFGSSYYLFPRKSMSIEEFDLFKEKLSEKIKNS